VILRKTDKGNLKVLVAHRPQYDDWSFPKGKADKGESSAETAIREILEETGLRCRIVAPLTTTRYRVGSGMKEVEWFVMRPLPDSPGFNKNNEVDKIKWMGRKAARKLLDYDHDRGLLTDFDLKKIAETGTIHLLRHATAGNRDNFNGDDRERPLTKKGKAQAKSIAESLREREIERIVTSPYKRCVQTVEPLAKMIGATIEISDALAEGPDIDAAYDLIHNLAGANAVLCSHGDVIPAAMNRLMWLGLTIHSRFYCSKGSIWEVDIEDGRYTEGRYVPPPAV
jgi:8-oxo-dGTP diphosphatase